MFYVGSSEKSQKMYYKIKSALFVQALNKQFNNIFLLSYLVDLIFLTVFVFLFQFLKLFREIEFILFFWGNKIKKATAHIILTR